MPRTKTGSLYVQKPSPLLKFSSEIRNRIWEYVVAKDGEVILRNHKRRVRLLERRQSGGPTETYQEDDDQRRSSQLALAFTCRQLYLEVTPIYYGQNTFRPGNHWFGGGFPIFEKFADAVGPIQTSAITRLCLYGSLFCIDEYLSRLPGLKRLYLMKPEYGEWHTHLKSLFFEKPQCVNWHEEMISLAQKHTSLTIVYDGEVWAPDRWSSTQEMIGDLFQQ
ncbi:MAG: hypothetical protein Q9161_003251 [Pseudevernia consocians]